MSNKDVVYKFEGESLKVQLDSDNDGKPSISLEAKLKEIVQEVLDRGGAIEGEKTVNIRMDGLKLLIELDSDKDGEKSLTLEFDIPEGFDEGMQRV